MTSLVDKTVGFIGAGAMAEALAGGLLAAGIGPDKLRAADLDPDRRKFLADRLGITTSAENDAVVEASDVVVLAVKPDVIAPVLASLGDGVDRDRPLWISIAAGVPIARIEAALSGEPRVVRAMPNTPALVRAGATAICGNARAGADDLAAAQSLFESVGLCWRAPDESLLDAVTGLSGSGPAYLFRFIEAMADAGEQAGLPRDAAEALAKQTVYGAALLAHESERSPAELRAQVSSPGGTTLAGLARLDGAGFSKAVVAAVLGARDRAKELGRG